MRNTSTDKFLYSQKYLSISIVYSIEIHVQIYFYIQQKYLSISIVYLIEIYVQFYFILIRSISTSLLYTQQKYFYIEEYTPPVQKVKFSMRLENSEMMFSFPQK